MQMPEVGQYCKAYPARLLRSYKHWTENSANVRKEQKVVNGDAVEIGRILTDDDVLYLQESYVVTDGIFLNENIIFDQVNEEWQEYCKSVLNFRTLSVEKSTKAEAPVSESNPPTAKKTRKPKRQKGENK
jgi:hypothetical protein